VEEELNEEGKKLLLFYSSSFFFRKMDELQDLYDEFGNYKGPDLNEDEDEIDADAELDADSDNEAQAEDQTVWPSERRSVAALRHEEDQDLVPMDDRMETSVVLHEDKKYYPTAEEVYPDTETLIQVEDTQLLSEPIIAPVKQRAFEIQEKKIPAVTFTKEFLTWLMESPVLIRNVALIGQLHHGKTSFMDMLVHQTHYKNWNVRKEQRYTDTRPDEQSRGISIKSSPMSLVLANTQGKSYLINLLDTPGHVNFSDEVTAAIRLADGVVVVVDAVEGVMVNTERMIRHAVNEKMQICLVVNKVDRLILELKLPPSEAYYKLRHTIDEVNELLQSCVHTGEPRTFRVSPELGNVCFASASMGWCFTLESFATIYQQTYGGFEASEFAKRLWGDIYFNAETRKFKRKPEKDGQRTFVQFILDPLFKIYSQIVGEDHKDLEFVLDELGIRLKKEQYNLDTGPLLKLVLSRFFGNASGFVDMLVKHIPAPIQAAKTKIPHTYTGPLDTEIAAGMLKCDAKADLMVHITKLYPKPDYTSFDAFGRISVFVGQILLSMDDFFSRFVAAEY